MPGEALFTLTVAFSLVTGTAAGLLSLLTWEILRRSPLGQAVFVLSIVLVIFILYHVIVLLSPNPPMVAQLFKSAMFTGATVFIWTMVWIQRRMRQQADGEVAA
ncbi:MAG: hypothetical protein ABEH81_16590 [Halopenitus sp.]